MKQVRRNVFETNSSSTHSVTILHKGLEKNRMNIGDDGYIHVRLGEFGWEVVDYTSQGDRLSYLLTMLAEKHGVRSGWWHDNRQASEHIAELENTSDFKRISNEVGKYAECNGVIIDLDDDDEIDGYIDHQSHEDYETVWEFLDDCGADTVEFVYGRGNVVHTDNDNY